MDKLQAFHVQASEYSLAEGENVCLNFNIFPENTQSDDSNRTKLTNQYILFVLDTSGSMAGTAISTCKQVLQEMFQYLCTELGNTNFDLILFDTQPRFIELKDKTLDQRLQAVYQITAGGGTAFIPVFEQIKKLVQPKNLQSVKTTSQTTINTEKLQDVSIVLLSDGQAENIQVLQPHIHALNEVFLAYTRNCEFHTLGFTRGHDARVLNELTLAGTGQGSFQFIESSKDIKGAMDAISGLFASKKLNGTLLINGLPEPLKVSFDENETPNGKKWEGMVFLDMQYKLYEQVRDSIKLLLQKGSTLEECQVTIKKEEISADDRVKTIKLNLLSIHENLRKITFKLTKQKYSQEEAEELNLKLNNYRKSTDDFIREIFKIKIAEREPLFEMVEDLKKYLATFNELIRSNFITQLNNEQIAQLNSMAYRNVTRKGLLKKLDKRAHKAVPIINEAFEKTKKLSEETDESALTTKYADLIDKIGCCALTCYNFVEAMKDEDCLCITFDMNRPEIAIADVTRITIKKIYPTIMSARAFMDSAKYALNKNSGASGGFSTETQGSIVKGIGSENITAVLPIYICKEHWDIASLLMKPILGWDITLDPVGYSYFQKKVVPFMLLTHAMKSRIDAPGSEFNNRVYELLLETCLQIIKDDMVPEFEGTMKEDVLAIHEKYLTDGSVRTLDQVQSNYVHLAHIYSFEKLGLVTKPTKEDLIQTLKFMAEEELRRKQTDWDPSWASKHVDQLLTIDVPKYLKKIEELEEQEEQKVSEGPQEISQEKEKEKPRIQIPTSEFLKGDTFEELSEVQKQAYNEYQELYKTIYQELFVWLKYFFPEDELNLEEYSTLEKIGFDTPAKFLALYMQNKLHAKNADRKSAFTSQRYLSPFNQDTAEDFLQRLYRKVVETAKTRKDKTSKANVKQAKVPLKGGETLMQVFARTSDLDEAVSILASPLTLGDFQMLQDTLRSEVSENCMVLEKLKIMKDGYYNGISFQMPCIMRKRFLRKLFKNYISEYNYNEWKEVWFK